ncbi:hypothetical protein SUDANB121_02993 [Nocardiopsis dassonvillei]
MLTEHPRPWPATHPLTQRIASVRQFSAAFLGPALGLLGALFRSPRGRHARTVGLLALRRRSKRVRRYAADPGPATARLPRRSPSTARPAAPAPAASRHRHLEPPSRILPADEIPLVRPYFTAHEQAVTRRAPDPSCADAVERELARVQEQALARLRGWTAPSGSAASGAPAAGRSTPAAPASPFVSPSPPAAAAPRRSPVPRPRLSPPGDLLAPAAPESRFRPVVPAHRRSSSPADRPVPGGAQDLGEPAAVTRRWPAQQERREVRV